MIQHKIARLMTVAFLLVTLIGARSAVWAYTPGACRQDGEKLCPGLADKDLVPCLKTHEAELSTDCKVNLAEARVMIRDAKDACQPDIDKYCAGVQVGQGRIRRCLKAHEADLSSACKDQIAALKKKYRPDVPAPAAVSESSAPAPGSK